MKFKKNIILIFLLLIGFKNNCAMELPPAETPIGAEEKLSYPTYFKALEEDLSQAIEFVKSQNFSDSKNKLISFKEKYQKLREVMINNTNRMNDLEKRFETLVTTKFKALKEGQGTATSTTPSHTATAPTRSSWSSSSSSSSSASKPSGAPTPPQPPSTTIDVDVIDNAEYLEINDEYLKIISAKKLDNNTFITETHNFLRKLRALQTTNKAKKLSRYDIWITENTDEKIAKISEVLESTSITPPEKVTIIKTGLIEYFDIDNFKIKASIQASIDKLKRQIVYNSPRKS